MKLKNFASVLLVLFAITGCDRGSNGNSRPLPPKLPKDGQGGEVTGMVCYSNALCLPSMFKHQVPDSDGDYVYPDPDDFPSADWRDQYAEPQYVLNLKNIDVSKKISANFALEDFISYRNGSMTFDYAVVMRTLVNKVQAVRNQLGKPVLITSGFRTPGYNETLAGSAAYSRHVYGDGVDIVSSQATAAQLKKACDDQGAYYTFAYADGHAHCDWRQVQLDNAFFPGSVPPLQLKTIDPYFITGGRIAITDMNDTFELSLVEFMPLDDHEGTPLYEWNIVAPTGETIQANQEKVILKKRTGTYSVYLLVGNSVPFEKTFTW